MPNTQVPGPEEKEVQPQPQVTTPEGEPKKEEDPKEPTLGEVLQTEPKTVTPEAPKFTEADFMAVKSKNKELQRAVKDLKKQIEGGATTTDTSETLQDLAEEFDVDIKFLKKLESSMRKGIEQEVEAKIAASIQPITEADKASKRNQIFDQHFDTALDRLPEEYKGIVNKDVIKTLSFQKENGNKTLSQLIEETYGKAIPGRRTLETTTPRGGKDPQEIDFAEARKNPAYFQEIMSDPALKKQYNEGLAERSLR